MRKTTAYARKKASGHAAQRNNGICIANMNNSRLSESEIDRIIKPCKAALQSMREARATYMQWACLCTAVHVAKAIEDGGVVRGQMEIVKAADEALHSIGERCGMTSDEWESRACTGLELGALADLVPAHSRQIHELTYREYTVAADLAASRVATDGGQVFHILCDVNNEGA
jgi:predicted transcriptional regulator